MACPLMRKLLGLLKHRKRGFDHFIAVLLFASGYPNRLIAYRRPL